LYLLQPLNVVPYLLLKRYYGDRILLLARSYVYYISKETFLLAFKVAFKKTFTQKNVCARFLGARLVLHNLKAVLLKLNMRLYTLTLLLLATVTYKAQILRNAYEIDAQLTLTWFTSESLTQASRHLDLTRENRKNRLL
jgi:hypothetical protein